MKVYSFPPISKKNACILVLGTSPGSKSLKLNQYYGHGGNTFWRIMFSILGFTYTSDYESKKKLLYDNKIALWDVLKVCEREGSSDNAILLEKANDFEVFYEQHPNIRLIAFNGKNAESYFFKYCTQKPGVNTITLPSTSPANTWMTLDSKISEWRKMLTI